MEQIKQITVEQIIDLSLKKYGVDFKYVLENPIIDGKEWYIHYTFDSTEEYLNWQDEVKALIYKNFPHLTDRLVDLEFNMIDAAFGLSHSFNKKNNTMVIKVRNISENRLPEYENVGDAGMDIRVDFSRVTPQNPIKLYGDGEIVFANDAYKKTLLRLEPGSRALIPTGLFTEFGSAYELQIRSRSGLTLKKGLVVANSPGTIDAKEF